MKTSPLTKAADYCHCSKCNTQLLPKKRHCPACNSIQFIGFNVVLPVIIVLFMIYILIKESLDLYRLYQLVRLVVLIPVCLLPVGIAIALYYGSKASWFIWTGFLGLVFVLCIEIFLPLGVEEPIGMGIRLALLIIYIITMQFTWKKTYWILASVLFLCASAWSLSLVLNSSYYIGYEISLTKEERIISFLSVSIVNILLIWTYSIRVRWWYQIRLGCFGPYIGEKRIKTSQSME